MIVASLAIVAAVTIPASNQAVAGVASPDNFAYLRGFLGVTFILGLVFGLMFLEDRHAKRLMEDMKREDEEALGGPFVSPWGLSPRSCVSTIRDQPEPRTPPDLRPIPL